MHFGHYRSDANSHVIINFHALKVFLALKYSLHLSRWVKGLSVMLEKKPDFTVIERLRGILLMGSNFNGANKDIFGNRCQYGFPSRTN